MKVLRSAKVHQESWKNFSNYWSSIPDRRRQSFDEGVEEGKFGRELDFRARALGQQWDRVGSIKRKDTFVERGYVAESTRTWSS